jgi:hypothetical protein
MTLFKLLLISGVSVCGAGALMWTAGFFMRPKKTAKTFSKGESL